MTGRTRAAAGLLLLAFIIVLSVTAAPALARSSPRVLRCPVVKRYAKYRGHQARLTALPAQAPPRPAPHQGPRRPLHVSSADDTGGRRCAGRGRSPRHRPGDRRPPVAVDAGLIMTASDVALLRERVAAGDAALRERLGSSSATARSRPPWRRRPRSTSARRARSATPCSTPTRVTRATSLWRTRRRGPPSYAAKARDFVVAWAQGQPSRPVRLHRRLPGRLPPVLRRVLVRLRLRPHAGRRRLLGRRPDDGAGVVPHLGLRHEGLSGQLRPGLLVHALGPRAPTTGPGRRSPTTRPTSTWGATPPPRRPRHGWRRPS